jgi:hypothetical protein
MDPFPGVIPAWHVSVAPSILVVVPSVKPTRMVNSVPPYGPNGQLCAIPVLRCQPATSPAVPVVRTCGGIREVTASCPTGRLGQKVTQTAVPFVKSW